MNNINIVMDDLWNNKTIVYFHIVSRKEIKNILSNGLSRTRKYPYILVKNRFKEFIDYLKNGESMVLIAIPDEVHKYIYEIDDEFFPEWKKQFDYLDNENCFLDEISYSEWDSYKDIILNYMPYALIYGFVSRDESGKIEFIKNEMYYDNLDENEKKRLCDLIKKVSNFDIEYEEFLSLTRRKLCDN